MAKTADKRRAPRAHSPWGYTYNRGTRTRNGGHYIVAARITRRNAVVVLDPLHGTLHELQGSRGIYMNHGLFGMMEYVLYSG